MRMSASEDALRKAACDALGKVGTKGRGGTLHRLAWMLCNVDPEKVVAALPAAKKAAIGRKWEDEWRHDLLCTLRTSSREWILKDSSRKGRIREHCRMLAEWLTDDAQRELGL